MKFGHNFHHLKVVHSFSNKKKCRLFLTKRRLLFLFHLLDWVCKNFKRTMVLVNRSIEEWGVLNNLMLNSLMKLHFMDYEWIYDQILVEIFTLHKLNYKYNFTHFFFLIHNAYFVFGCNFLYKLNRAIRQFKCENQLLVQKKYKLFVMNFEIGNTLDNI